MNQEEARNYVSEGLERRRADRREREEKMKMKDQMENAEDLELQAIMGSKFQDMSKAAVPKSEKKASADKKPCRKALDASWAPLKAEPTDIQRIVNCAKGTVVYGGLSAVLFWWQQAGLLASEAAWPSFIVLALLAGLKIGSCATRR